jgi:hypothetical protein
MREERNAMLPSYDEIRERKEGDALQRAVDEARVMGATNSIHTFMDTALDISDGIAANPSVQGMWSLKLIRDTYNEPCKRNAFAYLKRSFQAYIPHLKRGISARARKHDRVSMEWWYTAIERAYTQSWTLAGEYFRKMIAEDGEFFDIDDLADVVEMREVRDELVSSSVNALRSRSHHSASERLATSVTSEVNPPRSAYAATSPDATMLEEEIEEEVDDQDDFEGGAPPTCSFMGLTTTATATLGAIGMFAVVACAFVTRK